MYAGLYCHPVYKQMEHKGMLAPGRFLSEGAMHRQFQEWGGAGGVNVGF
jgi:hypothetical protein